MPLLPTSAFLRVLVVRGHAGEKGRLGRHSSMVTDEQHGEMLSKAAQSQGCRIFQYSARRMNARTPAELESLRDRRKDEPTRACMPSGLLA